MRERDLLNENYYGAYGHNRNRYNTNAGHNESPDWASRASDEATPRFGNRTPGQSRTEEQLRLERSRQENYDRNEYRQNSFNDRQMRYSQNPQYRAGNSNSHIRQQDYQDYDRYASARGRVGFTDEHRRGYNSHSMYAIPGLDTETGRRAYYPHANPEPYENHDRGLGSQFSDEVRSWFGDREAARRRQMDSRQSMGDAWPENRNYAAGPDREIRDRYYDSERDRDWVRNHNANNGW